MLLPALATAPRLTGLLRRVVNHVLPIECTTCGVALSDDPVPFFCRSCWVGFKPLVGPMCPRCGQPFASPTTLTYAPHHLCAPCRFHPPAYTRAWSLYPYVPPLQNAIQLFKYKRKVSLANSLGSLMRTGLSTLPETDILMPVPLHVDRLMEREFNQALLLADRLNHLLRLPLSYDNLVRLRPTQPQTELSRRARLKNLRRAFSLKHPARVIGKRILLVDDVFTTGTTVNECAKTLRKAGAKEVYVLTLARTC